MILMNKLATLFGLRTIQGHSFAGFRVIEGSVIVDLGANEGEFARQVLDSFDCRCLSVEPNPTLAESLTQLTQLELVQAAVGARDGQATFNVAIGNQASSLLPLAESDVVHKLTIDVLSLATLYQRHNLSSIALLKVDIEGAECEMLCGADQALLRKHEQISVEFHAFCQLSSPRDVRATKAAIRRAGFIQIDFEPQSMNTLFIRKDVFAAAPIRFLIFKPFLGPSRWVLHSVRRAYRHT